MGPCLAALRGGTAAGRFQAAAWPGWSCLEGAKGATPTVDGVRMPLLPGRQPFQLDEKSGASQKVMGPRTQSVGSPMERSCQKGAGTATGRPGREGRTGPRSRGCRRYSHLSCLCSPACALPLGHPTPGCPSPASRTRPACHRPSVSTPGPQAPTGPTTAGPPDRWQVQEAVDSIQGLVLSWRVWRLKGSGSCRFNLESFWLLAHAQTHFCSKGTIFRTGWCWGM